ncbi:MAG: hypothetical protein AAFQ94_22855 [Bacteroidota bacterium]
MKKLSTSTILTCFFLILLCTTGCFNTGVVGIDADALDDLPPGYRNEVEVVTNSPDASANPVDFKGVITINSNETIEVAYGFFWYDPNDPKSAENPARIDVGTTKKTISFEESVEDLPIERELIVCAFVERGAGAEMNIGDEVTFVAPKP